MPMQQLKPELTGEKVWLTYSPGGAGVGTYCHDTPQVHPCRLERDSAQAALSTGTQSHLVPVAHGPGSKYPPQLWPFGLYAT